MMPRNLNRGVWWAAVVLAAVAPVALLASANFSLSDGTNSGGESPIALALLGLFVVTVVWVLVGTLRQPQRFLRLAEWLTTVLLALLVIVLAWTAIAALGRAQDWSLGGSSGLSVSSSSISVVGETGTTMGRSSDAYERRWLRTRYGRGAAFADSSKVNVEAKSPSAAAWVWSLAAVAVGLGGYAAILWLLRGIFGRASRGAPFDPANARALRWIAGLIALDWVTAQTLGRAATGAVIESAGGTANFQLLPHFSTIGLALLALALGEIWRYGIQLQQEVEATV